MEAVSRRDWVGLLAVPIALLLLNWWNTNRSETNARERELKRDRSDLITQILRDEWACTVSFESISGSSHDLNDANYRKMKQEFNDDESKLYVDMLRVKMLFPEENGERLAKAIEAYMALGSDDEVGIQYARDHNYGKLKDATDKLQSLALQVYKSYVLSHNSMDANL